MLPSVVDLSSDLIRIPSVSRDSNEAVSSVIAQYLRDFGFSLEQLSYLDANGVKKVSIVGKKGEGEDGFGFFSHSDTVPGAEDEWAAFDPTVKNGKLYGRGSCDMKGPLAATMLAAAQIPAPSLKKPIYLVATSDEEYGFGGVRQVSKESQTFKENGWPEMGVVAEPTELEPVYAHKGGQFITVTAYGEAAHTSTEKGTSANFLIAPFLAEMAELKKRFMSDERFMDREFDPPTNGFNMTLNDGNCANNVTAAKTVCTLNLRAMPKARTKEAVDMIIDRAKHYGFETETRGMDAFYTSKDAAIVKLSLEVTGADKALAVPYGTEALIYQQHLPLVILGPGNIAQAHTVGEFVEVSQLERAVGVYKEMIQQVCC